jgi:hypothetical protein
MGRLECLLKTAQEKKECSGGEGCCIYDLVVRNNYCDKGGHKLRSEVTQPNHKEHWKKEEKKKDELK